MSDQILNSDLRVLADVAPDRCPTGWDQHLEPFGVHPLGHFDDL